MRYVCVHCDHKWEADGEQAPKRCPACLRANGPQLATASQQPAAAPRPRSKAALIALGVVAVLAAVGGYFVWGGRPSAGERGVVAPLSASELDDALAKAQVRAGDLAKLLVADPAVSKWAEKVAGSANGGPYAKAEAIHAAVRARASAVGFVPWSLGEPRASIVGGAAHTLAAIEKDGARFEAYPLELAALEVAALRALDVPALVAELIDVDGERAPLDPSGYLGYYVAAVYPGEPGLGTPRLFDPYGGRPLAQGAKHAVLGDPQVVGSALSLRALHEISYLGDPKRALDSSSHALILSGTLPAVRTVRGMVVLAGRLSEQGFQELEAARQQRDDAARKHNLASAALMTGDVERAEKELTAALERAPDFAAAHASRATLLLMKRDAEQARAEVEAADKLAPDLSLVQWARAELALRDGDRQQARTLAERAVRARPSFDARLRMGMLLRALDDTEGLRKLAGELEAMVPEDRKPEVREVIRAVLGPTALGDAPLPDAGEQGAPSAAPAALPGDPPPGDRPLQIDDEPGGAPSPSRPKKGPRLGDPSDRLRLRLDP
ncbi:MAG: hypothetical protein ABW252_01065 [Polyangiales bacterium]